MVEFHLELSPINSCNCYSHARHSPRSLITFVIYDMPLVVKSIIVLFVDNACKFINQFPVVNLHIYTLQKDLDNLGDGRKTVQWDSFPINASY